MNLIIIICSIAVTLYVIAETYTTVSGYIAEWKLERAEKKRLNSDLYRFKLKQLYFYCKSYYISCGYDKQKAEIMAINAVKDMDDRFLVDEKYNMIRGKNGNIRNSARCQ